MARAACGFSRDDAVAAGAAGPGGEERKGNGEGTATAVGVRAGDSRCLTFRPLYNACAHGLLTGDARMMM